MYKIKYSHKFVKAVRKCVKRGLDIKKLQTVVAILEKSGTLQQQYRPHKLVGKYAGKWECHISPDWLLSNRNFTQVLFISKAVKACLLTSP
ncbi:MAG: type II toxin-antitoxin system YafQ family toxin [Oscillospiraceae bacterium]|nr:type II toxin-antitoxin system YafQ family toxin [Oscillospiraceae bacterium]